MKNLYLLELSDIFANQVYLPYCSGVVWAYCNAKPEIAENYILKDWFYYRQDAGEIISKIKDPDVLAFSCFMWNWELNCEIAQAVKEKYPNCLVVFGGQHQPMGDRNQGFFEKYNFVDILVHHEGEESFYEILLENLNQEKNFSNILGISYNDNGNVIVNKSRPRMIDISETPSPYLNGMFDEIVNRGDGLSFSAIVESARGCPFSCAFCEIGESYYSKVKCAYEKTRKEIEWIAKNKIEYVTDANSNYGLKYKEDLDLAYYVKGIKEKYGYPHAYRVTWVKGRADKVLDIAKIFEEAEAQKGMTIALQSMNKDVLKAIARRNIDGGKLQEFIAMYEKEKIASYVELIWGLPEETYDSFVDGVVQILDYGYHNYLDIHLMMLLPNAPISSKGFINKYGIVTSETQPRFSHRDVSGGLVDDSNYFVTETNSFTREEWIKGHQFRWLVIFGHYLGPLQMIARGLYSIYGIGYKDFYTNLLYFAETNKNTLLGIEYNKIIENLELTLNNKRHWGEVIPEISNINWQSDEATCIKLACPLLKTRFYKEVTNYVLKAYSGVDTDVLENLVKYQRCRLSNPHRKYPFKAQLDYNIHDVIENDSVIKKEDCVVKFEGKSYNGNIFDWAKEILWFGRRVGKYKTKASIVI